MRGRQNRLGHLPSLLMRESVSPARQSWKPFSASLRPHPHESRTATLCDEFVVLVVGAVMKLDDSRTGPRFRFALAEDLGGCMQRVALEYGMGKFHVAHPEIGDRRADGEITHRHADHQSEREQRVHQRLAPLGLLLAKMPVD